MIVVAFALIVCLSLVSGRDFKAKGQPGISHSIVNLGRMDFNLYLNSKPSGIVPESPKMEYELINPIKQILNPKPDVEECPCQQNRLRGRSQDQHSPTDMLNKILMNNDLFSFKDPISSAQCCSSHEQIQEEFYVEFNPKEALRTPMHQGFPTISQVIPPLPPMQLPMDKMPKSMQFLPFFLDTIYGNKGPVRPNSKTIEILLFPTKKPMLKPVSTERPPATTPDIQIVGNKQTTMLFDLLSDNPSVKKDLTQDIGTGKKDIDSTLTAETTPTETLKSRKLRKTRPGLR